MVLTPASLLSAPVDSGHLLLPDSVGGFCLLYLSLSPRLWKLGASGLSYVDAAHMGRSSDDSATDSQSSPS